jgi:hypothetical protein
MRWRTALWALSAWLVSVGVRFVTWLAAMAEPAGEKQTLNSAMRSATQIHRRMAVSFLCMEHW